jgi:putative oxidoreductase
MNGSAGSWSDFLLLLFRGTVAVVFLAHGWNHLFGGGRLAGTARWFESLGMRPGRLHAWTASVTELGAGALLALGLVTPLAAAALLGTMVVALVTNHLKNGFFIFRPGEGYEYVLVLSVCTVVLGGGGAGGWSVDHALGILEGGWVQVVVTVSLGVGGALALLAACWRPRAGAVRSAGA